MASGLMLVEQPHNELNFSDLDAVFACTDARRMLGGVWWFEFACRSISQPPTVNKKYVISDSRLLATPQLMTLALDFCRAEKVPDEGRPAWREVPLMMDSQGDVRLIVREVVEVRLDKRGDQEALLRFEGFPFIEVWWQRRNMLQGRELCRWWNQVYHDGAWVNPATPVMGPKMGHVRAVVRALRVQPVATPPLTSSPMALTPPNSLSLSSMTDDDEGELKRSTLVQPKPQRPTPAATPNHIVAMEDALETEANVPPPIQLPAQEAGPDLRCTSVQMVERKSLDALYDAAAANSQVQSQPQSQPTPEPLIKFKYPSSLCNPSPLDSPLDSRKRVRSASLCVSDSFSPDPVRRKVARRLFTPDIEPTFSCTPEFMV